MKLTKEQGDQIPDSAWELEGTSADGLRRHWIAWIDREKGIAVRKTENLTERELLAHNRQLFNDSEGQRWGDGRVAARVPLNVFYQQVAPRLKDGDQDFMKWFLNNENNLPFRTFKGRV